jgi:hypothetical protein
MTEEQVALYGGAMWVGPLFLAGYLLLYWWFDNGPITRGGKGRAAERRAREAARRQRTREREDGSEEERGPP